MRCRISRWARDGNGGAISCGRRCRGPCLRVAQAVASLLVHLPEGDALACVNRGIDPDIEVRTSRSTLSCGARLRTKGYKGEEIIACEQEGIAVHRAVECSRSVEVTWKPNYRDWIVRFVG